MPVSFSPANHLANSIRPSGQSYDNSPSSLFKGACVPQWQKSDEILQSSFGPENNQDRFEFIVPRSNGFVNTVLEAYNQHHALIIRPDDVWLTILTQFNFFVNGNAELLRSKFVAHGDKKHLVIRAVGSRYTVDFGHMARAMTTLIHDNIVDPALRDWILPDFSTTTVLDTTVGAIIMMATMKSYFSYEFGLLCGIPRVTLEGEKRDWEKILVRLEKLKEYGVQTMAWYHLLLPVVSRFVRAFDDPTGQANIDFWQSVAHYDGGGSGPTWLSGWITAFCVFSNQGQWLGTPLKQVRHFSPNTLHRQRFFHRHGRTCAIHLQILALFLHRNFGPLSILDHHSARCSTYSVAKSRYLISPSTTLVIMSWILRKYQ
jgi:hypothetical protein